MIGGAPYLIRCLVFFHDSNDFIFFGTVSGQWHPIQPENDLRTVDFDLRADICASRNLDRTLGDDRRHEDNHGFTVVGTVEAAAEAERHSGSERAFVELAAVALITRQNKRLSGLHRHFLQEIGARHCRRLDALLIVATARRLLDECVSDEMPTET